MKINEFIYSLRCFHGKVHLWKERVWPILWKKIIYPKAVFLVMTPEHGNYGDHAIAYAEIKMLRKLNIKYIEVTGEKLRQLSDIGYINILNGRIILVNGGGNLGTLWFEVEQLTRSLISNNPKSPIMIFPNTIYYEDSEWGNQQLELSKKIYNRHSSLYICAREKISYDSIKAWYKNIELFPDMVMSLRIDNFSEKRSGCLVILRNDCEKTMNEICYEYIISQINSIFGNNILFSDMLAGHSILPEEREEALRRKFNEFRCHELVVTDRLHGMVFAAITETPCIVLNSKSPKIRGCYEWLKGLGYIKFINDPKCFKGAYEDIKDVKCQYYSDEIDELFYKMEQELMQLL